MALDGEGSLYEHTKGKVVLYLPAAVVRDSAFPFEVGDKLRIRIEGKRLIVERSR